MFQRTAFIVKIVMKYNLQEKNRLLDSRERGERSSTIDNFTQLEDQVLEAPVFSINASHGYAKKNFYMLTGLFYKYLFPYKY